MKGEANRGRCLVGCRLDASWTLDASAILTAKCPFPRAWGSHERHWRRTSAKKKDSFLLRRGDSKTGSLMRTQDSNAAASIICGLTSLILDFPQQRLVSVLIWISSVRLHAKPARRSNISRPPFCAPPKMRCLVQDIWPLSLSPPLSPPVS